MNYTEVIILKPPNKDPYEWLAEELKVPLELVNLHNEITTKIKEFGNALAKRVEEGQTPPEWADWMWIWIENAIHEFRPSPYVDDVNNSDVRP